MKVHAFILVALALGLSTGGLAQVPASFGPNPVGVNGPLASYKKAAPATDTGEGRLAAPSTVRTMPAYRVTEFRITIFRDRDIYTKAGMAAVSFRRHPGLLVGNPFKLNEALAYETFLRDDWNNTKSDYWDMAHAMALGGDPGEGRMIVKAIDDEDVRMRSDSENAATAPAMGRFQIASAETGTKLLELPEETINIPFIKKTW